MKEDLEQVAGYDDAERMVWWGASEEVVLDFLEKMGAPDRVALRIYERLHRERVGVIRRRAARTLLLGLALLATAGFVALRVDWGPEGKLADQRTSFSLCLLFSLGGAWKTGDGLVRILFAKSSEVSLADL